MHILVDQIWLYSKSRQTNLLNTFLIIYNLLHVTPDFREKKTLMDTKGVVTKEIFLERTIFRSYDFQTENPSVLRQMDQREAFRHLPISYTLRIYLIEVKI